MLKINKILSKKIKFSLSLRGLFPFCHSHESGNPSSMSLREAKQRSNLKGFSLIELMVAVVILAIAVLGIFLAFSNTWMGMADARDRTVATNYAREAMENIKNMDFEMVTNENLGIAESVGAKFTRIITVNTESDNLKKIDTTVYWTNRQGQIVSVEPSMYINRTLLNPGQASRIMLYADPYYTVLPTSGTANIIAVIKDIDGNTKIDWTGGNIRFLIIEGTDYGSLPGDAYVPGVEPTNGRADTIFTGSDEGDVVIEASVDLPDGGGTISNTITIRVTLDVVIIELSAAPDKMEANGTTISTVTAKLVNSGGAIVTEALNEITFNISGEGIFVDSEGTPLGSSTVPMTPVEGTGTATIHVKSIADTPGVATVTASSEDLLSGTVNIITTGVATSIYVSVNPDLIYTDDDEGAVVTVEIQDINGNPVKYSGNIDLAASDGTEGFDQNSLIFVDTSSESTNFSSASVGIVTIIASEEDIGGILTAGSAIIDVQAALTADTITLKAIPKNILAGGIDVSEITATIKQGSTVISTYNKEITFEIISDTSTYHNAELSLTVDGFPYGINDPLTVSGDDYGNDGVAVVYLKPASEVGICTIEVSTVNSLGTTIVKTIEVGFYASEDHIRLSADPPKMLVNGENCTVTAEVVDEGGTPVYTYEEDITFTILVGWPKIAKFAATGTSSLTTTLTNGTINVYLIPQKEAGTVTLKASSFTGMTDITGYLNIQVVTTLLELAPDPNIIYGENQVSFDIEVLGTEIILEEMQVSWEVGNPVENLDKIDIATVTIYDNDPTNPEGSIVYTDNLNERVADIDVTDTTLSTGISTITMYFDTDISGKTFGVIFNPNSGNYPVEINDPSI